MNETKLLVVFLKAPALRIHAMFLCSCASYLASRVSSPHSKFVVKESLQPLKFLQLAHDSTTNEQQHYEADMIA